MSKKKLRDAVSANISGEPVNPPSDQPRLDRFTIEPEEITVLGPVKFGQWVYGDEAIKQQDEIRTKRKN